jgi:hypothetical protein
MPWCDFRYSWLIELIAGFLVALTILWSVVGAPV